MKKALLLGIFDSTYIVQFINSVLIPLNYEVYIFPDSDKINNKFIPNEHLHVIYRLKNNNNNNKIIIKFLSIKKVYDDIKEIKSFGPFDLIHVHYVSYKALLIATKIKKSFKSKIAITYWGSDILRDKDRNRKSIPKFLKHIDYISSDSLTSKIAFENLYNNFKLNVVYFGDSICTEMSKLNISKINDYKKEFSIPTDKIIVTIGYNARPAQQHLTVIQEINNFGSDKFKNYHFIFPMTYCKEDTMYIKNLESLLSSSQLTYTKFDDYLSDSDIAKLRIISDIYINAQTTDAFCNTIKEFLYLKKTILNPVWLNYPEITQWKLNLIQYENFKELPEKLLQYSTLLTKDQLEYNNEYFSDKISWNNCKDSWNKIYEEMNI